MARRCPLCRNETNWEENPWRPFCSERCQMIDLGRWATEEYRVPLMETPEGLLADLSHELDRETSIDEQANS